MKISSDHSACFLHQIHQNSLTKLLALSVLTFFSSLELNAKNIVPEGKSVVLLTSEEVARLSIDSTEIETLAEESAQKLCNHLKMKHSSTTYKEFTSDELEAISSTKICNASTSYLTRDGIEFRDGILALTNYSKKLSISERIENVCYYGVFCTVIAGGLTTLILVANPHEISEAIIAGLITTGSVVLWLAGAISARLYRNYKDSKNSIDYEEITEIPTQSVQVLALPILATEILCE